MHKTNVDARHGIRSGCARSDGRRGAAMLFAISILFIFSALGMIYVRYMELELADADIELREKRARQLAMAGVECAAANLQQALLYADKGPLNMESPYQIEFPTYRSIVSEESAVVAEDMPSPRLAQATFTIYDESGKVNLNHAPASVLQTVMGISGEAAREIAASVPRGGDSADGKWFLELDELVTRGFLKAEDVAGLEESVTPYSVTNHGGAAGFFNVNAATPILLSAVLQLTPEQAVQVMGKGPFANADALAQAAAAARGVPVETVNFDDAIGFQSRCFRVVCEGLYGRFIDEERYRQASAEDRRVFLMNVAVSRVEAVLLFGPDGSYEIIHWNLDINEPA